MKRRSDRNTWPRLDESHPTHLESAAARYLAWMEAMHYAPNSLALRRQELRRFASWCTSRGVHAVSEVGLALLEDYRLALHRRPKGKPMSAASQQAYIVTLRRFFGWLHEQGRIPADPAAKLEAPSKPRPLPQHVLNAAEVEVVLAGVDVSTPLGLRDRALLEVLYSTAMRRSEALGLDLPDVDLDEGVALIRAGKGGRDRLVPLGRRAVSWLRIYLAEGRPCLRSRRGSAALFLSARGRLGARQFTELARRYVAKAELGKDGACHLFRHSTATLLLRNGANVRHLQDLLGHQDIRTTQRYTHLAIGDLKEMQRRHHPAS